VPTATVPAEVQDVLNRGRVVGPRYYLPDELLDRKLYVQVDKVLKALGGKWNREQKAHVFSSGQMAEKVMTAAAEGEYIDPKDYGFFETPPDVADLVVEYAQIRPNDYVLEPSAGRGRLCDAVIRKMGPDFMQTDQLECFEILEDNREILHSKGYRIRGKDFMQESKGAWERIVMNPPFLRNEYVDHVLHAYNRLVYGAGSGGRLVAIVPTGFLHNMDKKTRELRDLVNERGAVEQILTPGTFKEAGTNVATLIISINR